MRAKLFVVAAMAVSAPIARAGAAQLALSHSGRLFDASDKPVENGGQSMVFRFFSSAQPQAGEKALWEGSCNVAVTHGYYSVMLGEGCGQPLTPSLLPAGQARYLEVSVGANTLQPRLLLGTMPSAASALDAQALGGKAPDAFWQKTEQVDAATLGGKALQSFVQKGDPIDAATFGGKLLQSFWQKSDQVNAASLGGEAPDAFWRKADQVNASTLSGIPAQSFLQRGDFIDASTLGGKSLLAFWQKTDQVDAAKLGGRTAAELDARYVQLQGAAAALQAGNLAISGQVRAATIVGDGSGLTNLNPAQLSAVVPDSKLPANLVRVDSLGNLQVNGTATAAHFVGDGSGLTNLPASALTGTIADARIPASIARTTGSAAFQGNLSAAGVTSTGDVTVTDPGRFVGNGSGLTNLPASALTGTIADARIPASIARTTGDAVFAGVVTATGFTTSGNVAVSGSGKFVGDGSGLTNVQASALTGAINDALLSSNIARLNAQNTFQRDVRAASGARFIGDGSGLTNVPSSAITGTLDVARLPSTVALTSGGAAFLGPLTATAFNSGGDVTVANPGRFVGNGSGLTNLDASALMGQVSTGNLPPTVARLDQFARFTNVVSAAGMESSGNISVGPGGTFMGNGSGLTSLPASQLTGTVADALLSSNVALRSAANTFAGDVTVGSGHRFVGDGSGLTSLDAGQLQGTVGEGNLPGAVAYLDRPVAFQQMLSASMINAHTFYTDGEFIGSGAGLTDLDPAQLSGVVPDAKLPATLARTSQANTFSGSNTFSQQTTMTDLLITGATGITISGQGGRFNGDGGGLTNVPATALTGSVADARLSTNVPRLNATSNSFTGALSAASASVGGTLAVTGAITGNGTLSVAGNVTSTGGTFNGSGAGLANLNATNLATGTVADARLSTNVPRLNATTNTFTGTVNVGASLGVSGVISGDGSGLTNLNASQITSGVFPAARLPGTVAYTSGSVTFNGDVLGNTLSSLSTLRLAASNGICDTNSAGLIRWNGNGFEGCTGRMWVEFNPTLGVTQNNPGLTCKHILDATGPHPDGLYWIDPDGLANGTQPFLTYCDMTTSGGGWTLVAYSGTNTLAFPHMDYDVGNWNPSVRTGAASRGAVLVARRSIELSLAYSPTVGFSGSMAATTDTVAISIPDPSIVDFQATSGNCAVVGARRLKPDGSNAMIVNATAGGPAAQVGVYTGTMGNHNGDYGAFAYSNYCNSYGDVAHRVNFLGTSRNWQPSATTSGSTVVNGSFSAWLR